MIRAVMVPLRQHFPMGYHLPDFLDRSYVQWYIVSGLDEPTPIGIIHVPPAQRKSAIAIQRAYRAHLLRKRTQAMLAFSMALHPRLGAASAAAALGADALVVIKQMLV